MLSYYVIYARRAIERARSEDLQLSSFRAVSATVIFGLSLAISGCAGGSSSRMLPVARATSLPATTQQSGATATLKITIPRGAAASARKRRPNYVSPATNSLTIAQNGGAPTTIALTATSSDCSATSGALVCSLQFPVAPGMNQSFTVKTFASIDGSGTPLSLQTIIATIVANQANSLNFTLAGVVTSLSVALSQWTLQAGQPGTVNVVVNALDPSGNTIVGPGTFSDANGNPVVVTLADSDTSGATQLGTTSVAQAATIPLTYNGSTGVGTLTITATATNFASKTIGLSLTNPAVKLTVDQVNSAAFNVVATYQSMPHGNLSTDLDTLATLMLQSGAYTYAMHTSGGISALLSDGTPVLFFADHPESIGASSAAQARGAAPLSRLVRRSGATLTRNVTGLSEGPGPATGHEIAILVNTTDTTGAFTPSRQAVFGNAFVASGFTNANGYDVDVLPITIDNIVALGQTHPVDLLNIATHGQVFGYIPTPGVTIPPNLPTQNYSNLSDTTYTASLLSQYQSDFNAGNLLIGVNLFYPTSVGFYTEIAFTPTFVEENVTLNPGAVVINSSCFGQNSSIASAVSSVYQNAGAGQYIGWTKEVDGKDADETDAFLFDRLLGEQTPSITGLEAFVNPRTPAQRPFSLDNIETVESTELRGGPITRKVEPYTSSDAGFSDNALAPPLADGTLARLVISPFGGENIANSPTIYGLPSIAQMSVVESPTNGTLTINGSFPMNPGTVTVTDSAGKATLTPVTWTQSTITATLPVSGAQSAGLVQVFSAEGIGSNVAALTQWGGSLTYKENDSLNTLGGTTGSGTGSIIVSYAITFRADVHKTVQTIDTAPMAQNFAIQNVEANSTATVANYSGTFDSDDGKISSTYALSPTIPALTSGFPPLQPGTFEVRSFPEGSQPAPCNNGNPGPEGDAGNVLCPITGWYIPDGSLTCTDSGENDGCPDVSVYDQLGSYGGGFDAGGLLTMTMNPTTYAVSVVGTPTTYDSIHFGAADGGSLDPATATMTGEIANPSYTPSPTGPFAVHTTPRTVRPRPRATEFTRQQTLKMLRTY